MHRLLHVIADPGWKRDFENPDAEQWFERMNKIHIKSIWLSWNALCGEHRVQKLLTPESILWCVNRPNRWRPWLAVLLSWERQRASSDARFVHEIQWDTLYWNTNKKYIPLTMAECWESVLQGRLSLDWSGTPFVNNLQESEHETNDWLNDATSNNVS